MTVEALSIQKAVVWPSTRSTQMKAQVGLADWTAPLVRDLTMEERILRENQAPYAPEPEDALLADGDLLPRLIAEARREPPSADWERDLNEL
jgi:hypothetical protein